MKKVFKSLLALAFAWILMLLLMPTFNWDGSVCRLVTFTICDLSSGKSIPGVKVVLHDSIDSAIHDATDSERLAQWNERIAMNKMAGATDAEGQVELKAYCPAGGASRWGGLLGRRSGEFCVEQIVEIHGLGFRPLLVALASLVGERRFSLSKKTLEAKVWLVPIAPDNVTTPTK